MPISSRTGPLTSIIGARPAVVAIEPCKGNCPPAAASTEARTVGKYSGLQPAITALIAVFSTLIGAMFGGSVATTACGSLQCSGAQPSIRSTRSRVGGTTGRPSVMPWANMNS